MERIAYQIGDSPTKLVWVSASDTKIVESHTWYVDKKGYVTRNGPRLGKGKRAKRILLHNVLMNPTEGQFVDHIDRNPLNNTRENLRLCTRAENNQNRGVFKNSSTKMKGVGWDKKVNKWRARIQANGKRIHIGYYDKIEDANAAYEFAAKIYHKLTKENLNATS